MEGFSELCLSKPCRGNTVGLQEVEQSKNKTEYENIGENCWMQSHVCHYKDADESTVMFFKH